MSSTTFLPVRLVKLGHTLLEVKVDVGDTLSRQPTGFWLQHTYYVALVGNYLHTDAYI